jgi:hypothetical protein
MAQRYSSNIVTMDTSSSTTIGGSEDHRKKSALMPSRKSVDFAILPPPAPKRSRAALATLSSGWTPKQIVDGTSSVCVNSINMRIQQSPLSHQSIWFSFLYTVACLFPPPTKLIQPYTYTTYTQPLPRALPIPNVSKRWRRPSRASVNTTSNPSTMTK